MHCATGEGWGRQFGLQNLEKAWRLWLVTQRWWLKKPCCRSPERGVEAPQYHTVYLVEQAPCDTVQKALKPYRPLKTHSCVGNHRLTTCQAPGS